MLNLSNPFALATGRRRMLRHLRLCILLFPTFTTLAQTTLPARTTTAVPLSPSEQVAFANAQQSLKNKRYAEAFGRFAELADQGHVPSARMALALYDHGPALFGQTWSATPLQQRRWYVLAQRLNDARSFAADTEVQD